MFSGIYRRVEAYLKKTEGYSPLRFIIEFSILSVISRYALAVFMFVVVLIFLLVMVIVSPGFDVEKFQLPDFEQNIVKEIRENQKVSIENAVSLVIAAPMLETLIFQTFLIWLAKRFSSKRKIAVLFSTLVFAAAHGNLLLSFFLLPVGFLLAWSYIVMRERSRLKAFLTTSSIHALFNLSSLIFLILFE